MKKRITINIDEKTIAKLRKLQAETIQKESRNVSMSEIVDQLLIKGVRK